MQGSPGSTFGAWEITSPSPAFHGSYGYNAYLFSGYVNGLFLDWSVGKVGRKELWTLQWSRDFDTTGRWAKAGGVQPEDRPA
jgi:hypothetical protein